VYYAQRVWNVFVGGDASDRRGSGKDEKPMSSAGGAKIAVRIPLGNSMRTSAEDVHDHLSFERPVERIVQNHDGVDGTRPFALRKSTWLIETRRKVKGNTPKLACIRYKISRIHDRRDSCSSKRSRDMCGRLASPACPGHAHGTYQGARIREMYAAWQQDESPKCVPKIWQ